MSWRRAGSGRTLSAATAGAARAPGRRRLVVAVLVGALALAGCSLVSGLVRTTDALQSAGYPDASVGYPTNGGSAVTVQVDRRPDGGTVGAQTAGVASVVWQNLPGSFTTLTVEVRGLGAATFTHAGLERSFGPRPSGLDDQTVAAEVSHQGTFVLLGLVAVVILVALAVVVLWRSVRRGRRTRRVRRLNNMMASLPPELWDLETETVTPTGPVPPSPPVRPAPGPGRRDQAGP